MTVEEDLSYAFDLYQAQSSRPASPASPPAATSRSAAAVPVPADSTPQQSAGRTIRSPFEAMRDVNTACSSSSPRASGTLEQSSSGMFTCNYSVPASPFATYGVIPPTSAFANSKTWSMENMLADLRSALPTSTAPSPDGTPAPALHPHSMVSVSSA